MTKKKDKEVIRKGNELADKLIEVLRKELGEESPTSITVYAAAKFSASVLYGVRKLTEDDAAVKVFFYAVSSFLGDEIESSDIQAVLDKVKEARQKFAEHRKMEAELEITGCQARCDSYFLLSRRNAFLIENLESSELLSIFAIRIIK